MWNYPDNVPEDAYRRHANCKCTVDYICEKKKTQNVHAKLWYEAEKDDTIKTVTERAKENVIMDFVNSPKLLSAYMPGELKSYFEKYGIETKPLSDGNYAGVSFEQGGGFKVNFFGDGVFMYHPVEHSHHGGEYYKVATGKGGKIRYDAFGNQKQI